MIEYIISKPCLIAVITIIITIAIMWLLCSDKLTNKPIGAYNGKKSEGEDEKPIEKELRQQSHEIHLERVRSIYKFHFFFAGLVFAILSFAIQYPVKGNNSMIRGYEALSWGLLAFTGLLALKQIGGFAPEGTNKYLQNLRKNWMIVMWSSFVSGLVLLIIVKIVS